MKIISKYKDYYDYLVGIYGEDPKLVLDRRQDISANYNSQPENGDIIKMFICGLVYTGMFINGKYCYGEDLIALSEPVKRYDKKYQYVKITLNVKLWNGTFVPKTFSLCIDIEKSDLNDKHDCPIMVYPTNPTNPYNITDSCIVKYPKLIDYNFASVIGPEEIFNTISNWLSTKITERENIIDTRTDFLKLESKGFDKKRSFRPNMK